MTLRPYRYLKQPSTEVVKGKDFYKSDISQIVYVDKK